MKNIILEHNKDTKIITMTLNKQPFNICEKNFYTEIMEAIEIINAIEEDAAVVLLKSGCKHFCGGGELEEIQSCSTPEQISVVAGTSIDAFEALYNCRYPIVCAVNKMAVGAGTCIAACCDVIVAADDAQFSLREITAGYIGASEFLELILPRRLARYYIFTGSNISAQEMYRLGAIYASVPANHLIDRATEIAKDIAEKSSPLALQYFKKCLNYNDDERLKEKYMYEATYLMKYNLSEDCKENYAAIKEKRKPNYKGR